MLQVLKVRAEKVIIIDSDLFGPELFVLNSCYGNRKKTGWLHEDGRVFGGFFVFALFSSRAPPERHVVRLRVDFYLLTLLPAHGQSQLQLQLLLTAGLRSGLLQVRGGARRRGRR